jgi:hypothetical protein
MITPPVVIIGKVGTECLHWSESQLLWIWLKITLKWRFTVFWVIKITKQIFVNHVILLLLLCCLLGTDSSTGPTRKFFLFLKIFLFHY